MLLNNLIKNKIIRKKNNDSVKQSAKYFPAINQLNISDDNKKRLDMALMILPRNYIPYDILSKYGLSLKDCELLREIKVLEKYYGISCEKCGFIVLMGSYNDLEHYRRVYQLCDEARIRTLSYPEEAELDSLHKSGYYTDLQYECISCDCESKNISSLEQLDYLISESKVLYKLVETPKLQNI